MAEEGAQPAAQLQQPALRVARDDLRAPRTFHGALGGPVEDVVHGAHHRAARGTLLDATRVESFAGRALGALAAGALRDDERLHEIGPQRCQRGPHAEHRPAARAGEIGELSHQALLVLTFDVPLDGKEPYVAASSDDGGLTSEEKVGVIVIVGVAVGASVAIAASN